jgi:hypothetical protein
MSRSTSPLGRPLTVVEPAEVSAHATVVHFDQLSDAGQEWVIERVDGRAGGRPLPAELSSGDVVVFTDYLRVTEQ